MERNAAVQRLAEPGQSTSSQKHVRCSIKIAWQADGEDWDGFFAGKRSINAQTEQSNDHEASPRRIVAHD